MIDRGDTSDEGDTSTQTMCPVVMEDPVEPNDWHRRAGHCRSGKEGEADRTALHRTQHEGPNSERGSGQPTECDRGLRSADCVKDISQALDILEVSFAIVLGARLLVHLRIKREPIVLGRAE